MNDHGIAILKKFIQGIYNNYMYKLYRLSICSYLILLWLCPIYFTEQSCQTSEHMEVNESQESQPGINTRT